ncbi:MAG: iron-sulfur cluster assembly accessory protein [Parachlamydiaceae bacterium]|nr:iron-sulfur cluster assembly accessory protein [Parachlamydiaceae bacterium]
MEEEYQQTSCCSAPSKKEEQYQQTSCCSAPSKKEEQSSCCSTGSKKEQKTRVSRDMTIEDILGMFPHKAQKLSQEITNAGLHCVGCHAATWETLETGMMTHGKTNEQINHLVDRLNILLAEKVDPNTISITPRGASKFIEIASDENKQGWGIRFSEEMAGCNGFEYTLDFSEKADANDQVFSSNGIDIHVKKALVARLVGSEIDYVDGLRGSGFKVSNPNVNSSCGCGSSHGY